MLLRKSKSDNRANDSHEEDKEEIKLIDDKDSHIKKLQKEVEKLREELDISKETVEKRKKICWLTEWFIPQGNYRFGW